MARTPATLAALFLFASSAPARTVEVTVDGVGIDAASGNPVVRLVEKARGKSSARELPIWIGPFEAQAIALEIQGVEPARPLTHDLMKGLVERLGGRLSEVSIGELRGSTYIATLVLQGARGERLTVDARPSDAIALALRVRVPILVAEDLFARPAPVPTASRMWGLTVQDMTLEVATFFGMSDGMGVLVSDVDSGAPARDVRRGDVITALDGRPVASVGELARRAAEREDGGRVRLSLRRSGRPLDVTFSGD